MGEGGHRFSLRVTYGDTDCGGVVYYASYLRFFEIGRTELLRSAGLSYRQIEEEEGLILPVVEVHVRYRSPARYDDLLTVETRLTELTPRRARFDYLLWRDHRLLTEGYTVHVPVTREGRLTRFPAGILQRLEPLVASASHEAGGE